MKRSKAITIITARMIVTPIVVASMFVLGAAPHAQARECSNASLKGAYGFHQGQIGNGAPVGVLGRAVFDGKGNVTTTATINANGTVFHAGPGTETYTVNADCTGTIIPVPGANVNIREIVLVDGGKEFYILVTFTNQGQPSPVVTLFGVGKKQFPDEQD
jgi:hypothetical protein